MLTFEQKSENFTKILNEAANSYNCVFFEDCGEGNDLETDTLYCENVSGWLIPRDKEIAFSSLSTRKERFEADEWGDCFVFAEWKKDETDIVINFKKYPQAPLFEERVQIDETGFRKVQVFNSALKYVA
jgi:hypothetical protein